MTSPTTIWLVRHGHVHNPRGIIYGRLPRFRLSERGLEEARAAGRAMAGIPIAAALQQPAPAGPTDRRRDPRLSPRGHAAADAAAARGAHDLRGPGRAGGGPAGRGLLHRGGAALRAAAGHSRPRAESSSRACAGATPVGRSWPSPTATSSSSASSGPGGSRSPQRARSTSTSSATAATPPRPPSPRSPSAPTRPKKSPKCVTGTRRPADRYGSTAGYQTLVFCAWTFSPDHRGWKAAPQGRIGHTWIGKQRREVNQEVLISLATDKRQVVQKQVSGRQPRRGAFWDAQHTGKYVSRSREQAAQRRITARDAVFQQPVRGARP